MSQDKFINVREVLQQNSYTTTVDELRNRGKSRVRVINAEQISALIEEAVNRTVATSAGVGRDEVKDLVKRSQEKFRQLLAEKEKELAADRERVRQLEQFKEDLAKTTAEAERLRITEVELRRQNEALSTQVADLKVAAKSGGGGSEADRIEIEKLRKAEAAALKDKDISQAQLAEMRRLEADLRKAEQDSRKEKENLLVQVSDSRREATESRKEKESLLAQISDLKASIKELEKRPTTAAPAPAPVAVAAAMPPEMVEMLKSLATEVASVKAGLKEAAAKPAVAAASGDMTALIEKMDKIGKKVGISAGGDASEVNLDAIFNPGGEAMESNIGEVEVKERKGGGIAGALERMKALRGGKKKEEKKD